MVRIVNYARIVIVKYGSCFLKRYPVLFNVLGVLPPVPDKFGNLY